MPAPQPEGWGMRGKSSTPRGMGEGETPPQPEGWGMTERRRAWMALYHVWFSTKGRKWLLEGEVGEASKELMVTVAKGKNIDLGECEMMVDHAPLLLAG